MTTPTPEENAQTLWELLAELAQLTGAAPLNQRPGCWYIAIGQRWELAINAHREPQHFDGFRDGGAVDVDPFHAYVRFNGWPAGMLSPHGGVIAAGDLANLSTLCQALRDHITGRGSAIV